MILVGMIIMLFMQWIGLNFIRFEKLGIDLMEIGIRFMPISIISLVGAIILKIIWEKKK